MYIHQAIMVTTNLNHMVIYVNYFSVKLEKIYEDSKEKTSSELKSLYSKTKAYFLIESTTKEVIFFFLFIPHALCAFDCRQDQVTLKLS